MFTKQLPRYMWLLILSSFILFVHIDGSASDKQPQRREQRQSGIGWAMQAMQALTGGIQVTSVTENGTVTRTSGGDHQQGSITLQSSGLMTNQLSLSLTRGTLSETRTWQNGSPGGSWTGFDGVQHPMAQHNCWTDAGWFFPALSLLAGYTDPTLVFTDLGQEQYQGGLVEHIQVYRTETGLGSDDLQLLGQMSLVDFYLDSQTALPVAMAFVSHADGDLSVNIPVMIVYTNYTNLSGIQVPFQVVRSINGSTMLQLSISNAYPNH